MTTKTKPTKKNRSRLTKRPSIEEILALAGSWGDLDWDEMEKALDHIRHDSKPTSPFEL